MLELAVIIYALVGLIVWLALEAEDGLAALVVAIVWPWLLMAIVIMGLAMALREKVLGQGRSN